MKTILVAGGAGYIGSHVVWELIKKYNVIVIDNLSTGHKEVLPKEVKFVLGNITNDNDLDKVFKENKIDCVMNFAAKIVVPESVSNPLDYYHNNTEGVRLIIKNMVKYNVKNIVFSSTAAVYGQPEDGVCNEDSTLKPINPYGESKLASEKLIQWCSQAYGFNYFIFRYFNVAGADSKLRTGLISKKLTHIIPIINRSIIEDSVFTIYGNDYKTQDGTCIRDYVHVSDIALAHVKGLEYLFKEHKSNIANLGSNNGFSNKEIVDEALNFKKFKYVYGPRREGDPDMLIASNNKAKELLNWTPKKSLKEMIESDYKFRKMNEQK